MISQDTIRRKVKRIDDTLDRMEQGLYTGVSIGTVTDEIGIAHTVYFSRPVLQFVTFYITLKTYDGFDPAVHGAAAVVLPVSGSRPAAGKSCGSAPDAVADSAAERPDRAVVLMG